MLSMVFPVSFALIGIMMGIFLYNLTVSIILGFLGLIIGILLDMVCYYRKLFTAALFQGPIPLALFLLFWWISDTLVSEVAALGIGVIGLIIGLWLNSELVVPYQFYKIKKRYLAIIYLFFSMAFMGFFMGIPVFNILLGVLAGNYLSIRIISNYKEEREINRNMKQGSVFTSVTLLLITGIAALLAISDLDNSILVAQQVLHFPVDKTLFYLLITLGGLLIVLFQYYLTLFTAKTMLQLWKHKRFSRYTKK